MADNHIQEMDNLKEQMNDIFSFSSQVPYEDHHLLSVAQASKSLIGMSLNNPPRNLLIWLEQYIKNFQPDYQLPKPLNNVEEPEIISTHYLKELIKNNNIEQSRNYLIYLINMADAGHIMELLLEISLHRSAVSTLFCWYALKSIPHVSAKESIAILFLSLESLYNIPKHYNNKNKTAEKFYIFCHSYQMKKTQMVRSGKLAPLLSLKIKTLIDEGNNEYIIPEELLVHIREGGEKGLVQYLSKLKIEKFSYERILLLDALRSILLYASESDDFFSFQNGKMKITC